MVYIRYTHTCITDFMPHIHGRVELSCVGRVDPLGGSIWLEAEFSIHVKCKDFMPHIHVWHRFYATYTCMT